MENNREFIISTDTNSDLPFSFIDENNINLMGLGYTMDGVTRFSDDRTIDPHDFYERMRAGGMPTTMQINPEQAEKSFEALVTQGFDVLHIAFSSGLSGSYNSAEMGAAEVRERYPEAKVVVIDSLSASLGQGLMVYYAVQLKKAGKSLEETAAWIESHRQNFLHYFTVEDLNHLYRGGRVSKATAVFGTMLGIKPVMYVDAEGHLVPMGKVRGRKQSMLELINRMGPKMEGMDNEIVFISHGDALDEAKFCAEEIKKKYKIKNFLFNYVGPTIGAHSGPGTIAIFFLGKDRTEGK
ncbi:DegV family protein [Clostridiaceae bacterium NSJ-31]|uniref:DegV family protein n=1 Tax=Ligaoa zhengdingensis TaxID=2763658 RepID=A0A926DYP7_9FIRM|nr:DegV family protein [Ligaoa zhengdingensis]MBC8547276.1 DegV family protein [Ligaoa zhengdingensis]